MVEYTNLNEIVQYYNISREGGVDELKSLQERLSNVPVDLSRFEDYLNHHGADFSCLLTRAEIEDPDMRLFLLDDLTDTSEEADDITERMELPYIILYVNGDGISNDFYKKTKKLLGQLIRPDVKDETTKVMHRPFSSGVAVIYERDEKLQYIEMYLVHSLLI